MSKTTPRNGGRKQIWKAAGGTAAFVVIGLLLTPGLARREAVEPEAKTPLNAPAFAKSLPSGVSATLAEAGDWLDGGPDPSAVVDEADSDRAFDCMIGPSEVVEVGSAITAILDDILVERSDYVEAGEVVAQLESTVEQAAVDVARARAGRTDDIESSRTSLQLSEKRLTRARELFDRDVLSLDRRQEVEAQADLASLELDRAQEDHRLAKLQLEQALANLERRTIRTPVAGVVVERLLSPGEVVDEETVVRIAQVDPLRIEAILPASWFGRMKPGDRAEIVPEAPLDDVRSAEVVIVDPVLEAASGTFTVQLDLPNADRALPAGLRCQVRFSPNSSEPGIAEAEETDEVEGALSEAAEMARIEKPPSIGGLTWELAPSEAP